LLPDRFTWIDDTNRGQHYYLEPGDRCMYFGEYFAGKGYQGGDTNQLIHNLKIKPTALQKNPARARYKNGAIQSVAATLARVMHPNDKQGWTWVPVPTSKCPGHPDYDQRLHRILATAFQGVPADVRPLLRQTASTEADHEASSRIDPDELYGLLEVDVPLLGQQPIRGKGIILFDDVLTSGKHFRACVRRLRGVVPATTQILGMFVARRVIDVSSDFKDLTV
jgi:hypothetical protein